MWKWLVVSITIGFLAGCGGGSGASRHNQSRTLNRYTLANSCFALKSVALDRFVTRSNGGYHASAKALADAAAFYLKPSALGKYMLYTRNQSLLAAAGQQVQTVNAPRDQPSWDVDEGVIWLVKQDEAGRFSLRSMQPGAGHGLMLAVNTKTGALTLAPDKVGDNASQRFMFVPAEHCATFPEIETDTIGETFAKVYKPESENPIVVGFADVHSHISATDFLGGAHVGQPFSKYGVALALPKGVKRHGYTGFFDLIGNFYAGKPFRFHDTQGWPTFEDWPAYNMLTYESAYYRWIKRAYKAGLRLLVNNLVQNDALCSLNKLLRTTNPADPRLVHKLRSAVTGLTGLVKHFSNAVINDIVQKALNGVVSPLVANSCNGMKTAIRQAAFMYRMEAYIDAQNGGPGKGWFRIVKTPDQARRVIKNGKLAVVLGLEISNAFGCRVSIIPLAGKEVVNRPDCTKQQIKDALDLLYQLGVRQINLIHEFNNALGGTGIFNGGIINVGNFADTDSFWQTHDCDLSRPYFYTPGALMTSANPLAYLGENPLARALNTLLQGTLPFYPTDVRQCNDRGITQLGRFAVKQTMKHHMMIDVDHMSVKMKSAVIQMALERNYPVISTHGGHGGITMQQARNIMKTGGLINPIDVTPKDYLERLKLLKQVTPDDQLLAQSYTSDVNGMAAQPGPSKPKISYPFTLFEGKGFEQPMFDGIEPVTFKISCIDESGRCFNYNKEGVAHYGLYADWVQALRKLAVKKGKAREVMKALYSSAEHYLRVWERAWNAELQGRAE